ncbi:hypothetical protein E2C01_008178 [Portunus trituberculatus]|uniref:Uncharacterized protein n=1 Tax=Portunus trituberculatus TaxID=210409 RepID=A0A5B7D1M9_PORTR|nr:hypothetical protein [Portunus trituberculatus]
MGRRGEGDEGAKGTKGHPLSGSFTEILLRAQHNYHEASQEQTSAADNTRWLKYEERGQHREKTTPTFSLFNLIPKDQHCSLPPSLD